MSIMGIGRRNGNSGQRIEPTPPPYPPLPAIEKPHPAIKKDPQAAQIELGSVMLDAVDRVTGMTAEGIERVAEQIIDGAEETAAILRELARRVRENGLYANERLARFVRVANQCADIARSMQGDVERLEERPTTESKAVELENVEPKQVEVENAEPKAAEPEKAEPKKAEAGADCGIEAAVIDHPTALDEQGPKDLCEQATRPKRPTNPRKAHLVDPDH